MNVGDLVTSFDIWFHVSSEGPKMVFWWVAFLAIVWVICRIKNRIVFQHDMFNEDDCVELCRFNLYWCAKA